MAGVANAVGLINQATDYANKSGEALQFIVGMAAQTVDQVQAIAAASEEQSAASKEINPSGRSMRWSARRSRPWARPRGRFPI